MTKIRIYYPSGCLSQLKKMGQILITCRNYMDCEPNIPFCSNNSLHDWLTPDISPYFNVCFVWAIFFVFCVWTVKAFEKVVYSVSASKNGL